MSTFPSINWHIVALYFINYKIGVLRISLVSLGLTIIHCPHVWFKQWSFLYPSTSAKISTKFSSALNCRPWNVITRIFCVCVCVCVYNRIGKKNHDERKFHPVYDLDNKSKHISQHFRTHSRWREALPRKLRFHWRMLKYERSRPFRRANTCKKNLFV